MRFHVGFSKRISLKWILTIIGGLLAFFGIYINTQAASFDVVQNWSTCDYGTTDYASNNCTIYNSSVYVTSPSLNNVSNVLLPNGAYEQNPNLRQNKKKTEIYKYGGVTDCASGSNINLYVDAVMGGYNGSFADNVLDPNQFPIVTTRGAVKGDLRATCPNTWCDYWPWLSNNNSDSQNKTGVRISKTNGVDVRDCTFVNYGSNKTVRFLCSVPSGNTGYQIILNEYNNGYIANTNLMSSVGIKTTVLSDPCKTYPNDQTGVIDSIGDQTASIVDGFSGIIDNQNENTEEIKDKIDEFKEQEQREDDETQEKLDDIKDGIDSIDENTQSCKTDLFNIDNNPYDSNVGYLRNNGAIGSNSSYRYTDYLKVGTKSTIVISSNLSSSPSFCIYNSSKELISCTAYGTSFGSSATFTIDNSNAYYIRLSYYLSSSSYMVTLKRCSGIGDTLIDSDVAISENPFGSISLVPETPISNLLYMPINLAQKMYDNISMTTCSPYNVNFTLPGNNNVPLSFTCPDYNDLIGSTPTTIIDSLLCFGLIWGICMAGIHFFESWSSLTDTFDNLYKGGAK